jgi:hypothetical protein
MKRYIIWAGNHEKAIIDRAREVFKAVDQHSEVLVRNADVYAKLGGVEKCDGAYIQPEYPKIIADFKAAGIPLLNEETNERSTPGCGEGNEGNSDDDSNPQEVGGEAQNEARISAPETGAQGDRLANGNYIPEPGRRGKQARKAQGRKAD